jgi:hypothetical protein
MPSDPVLEPESAAPGETVRVRSDGLNTATPCDSRLTSNAHYRIRLKSFESSDRVDFPALTPTDVGGLDEVVVIPEHFPKGMATVDLLVDGPELFCEVDQTLECGRSVAQLRVVGTE